jgi:CheY-like chemotaxis protein
MSKKLAVIFVDDVADWRKMMLNLLTQSNYAVVTAEDSATAQAALAAQHFDAAVFDMRLDETDERNQEGLELAQAVREQYPDLPIIILTGYGTNETIDIARKPDDVGESLVDDFVAKDEVDSLPERLAAVIARRTTFNTAAQ